MHERLIECLDHELVELGVLAVEYEPDPFVQRLCEIAHRTLMFAEHSADGDHPQLHHRVAKLAGHRFEPARGVVEIVSDDHRVLRSRVRRDDGTWHEFMRADYRRAG